MAPGRLREQPRGAVMTERSLDTRPTGAGRLLRSRVALTAAIAALAVAFAVGVGHASGGKDAATPHKGGTLRFLGQSDIFNLDTTSGYYTVDNILERSFTRQLLSYRNTLAFVDQIKLVPDVATSVPTRGNG